MKPNKRKANKNIDESDSEPEVNSDVEVSFEIYSSAVLIEYELDD